MHLHQESLQVAHVRWRIYIHIYAYIYIYIMYTYIFLQIYSFIFKTLCNSGFPDTELLPPWLFPIARPGGAKRSVSDAEGNN